VECDLKFCVCEFRLGISGSVREREMLLGCERGEMLFWVCVREGERCCLGVREGEMLLGCEIGERCCLRCETII